MNLSIPVAAGTTSEPITFQGHSGYEVWSPQVPTVTAIPGSGGSLLVQYSTSPPSQVAEGSANWFNWPNGSVTANTSNSLPGKVTAIRAIATTAAGVLEYVD